MRSVTAVRLVNYKKIKSMKKNSDRQRVFGWLAKGLMLQSFSLISLISFAANAEDSEVKTVLNKIEETGDWAAIKSANRHTVVMASVSGKITDAKTGEPLSGVNVAVKGTAQGTNADADGKYALTIDDPQAILVFSFVGYISQEIAVSSRSVIDVQLAPDEKLLDEVVVVGYGTQKKGSLTGAVSSVSSKDLANRPITDVGNALQGKLPGVTVVTNNGQPGRDEGSFYIRGMGTGLGGSPAANSPLVVVNGVVASLNELNPSDIESITVLKDAASAAIYGARASNGVILVTTKKGTKGKIQVNYDWYGGIQQITRRPDFLPSWDEAQLYNEARANEDSPIKWTPADIEKFKDGSDPVDHPNTDWLSLLYTKPGIQQNHNLSITGGDEKSSYVFSLGYLSQTGNVAKTSYKKYNARFGVTTQIRKNLSVNGNIGFLYSPLTEPVSTYATSFSQLLRTFNRLSSILPSHWGNGAYGYVSDGSALAWLESPSLNSIDSYTLTGNAGADWSPVKGLHIKPSVGYRLALSNQKQYVADIQYYQRGPAGSPLIPTTLQGPNKLTHLDQRTTYTLSQAVAEYELTLGKHYFKLLGGASREYQLYDSISAVRQGFLNNTIIELNAAPKDGQQTAGTSNDWALESFFGRFNYDYDSKYLLEVNFRYDGSSRFAKDKRWGAFPSLSAGWVISEEGFFGSLRNGVWNFAKLRASWGKLGNQQISNYPTYATIATGQNYSFNQGLSTGIAPKAGNNADVTWESTVSSTAGADFAFFSNKLTFSGEYFERNTNNILMKLPLGSAFGLSSPYQNSGAMTNKGWEFMLGYNNKVRELTYGVSANLTYVENKVTELKGTGPILPATGTFYDVGYPFRSLYGFECLGIYQDAAQAANSPVLNNTVGAGDLIYKDQNGDGVINAKDRVYLGQYFPKITYGVTVNAGWRNWDLSFFLQGVGGVKASAGNLLGSIGSGDVQRPTAVFMNRWTPDNPSADFPKAWFKNDKNDPASNPSSFWVKDASYLRMKNLTLGYTLPKSLLNRLNLTKVRLYYSGQNIFTLSSFYKWIDPEIGPAASIYNYPQVKTHTVGVNVGF